MKPIICAQLLLVSTVIRSRVSLQLEIVALRHHLLCIRGRPSARRLAPETVFSGRGSRVTGRGGGMRWFCPDGDCYCLETSGEIVWTMSSC
jgi:hypothetical protein